MSTNGTAAAPKRSTTAAKLFDLFRDREEYELKDSDGKPFLTVIFQALDWQQNNRAARALDDARFRVRAEMEKNGIRDGWKNQVADTDKSQAINIVIAYEKPTAESVADLAPNGTSEENPEAEKKEETALEKWEKKRREELESMEVEEVHALLVERQENLYIQARALDNYMNEALAMMVIDPETGEPLLTADPDDGSGRLFVASLMPEVRQQLMRIRQEFINQRSEKAVRKGAESKDFLSSGESPSPDTATPGETTATRSRSRRSPSTSTTVAAG